MSSPIVVDLFVEDRAHEEFLKALLDRIAREVSTPLAQRVRSARGGHGRVLEELSLYQRTAEEGFAGLTVPDLLVVAIDGNCNRPNKARRQIEGKLLPAFRELAVVACPDPHIERWYLADPESFVRAVGVKPRVGKRKCIRDRYKVMLARAVAEAGHPPMLGGIEFAREIVEAMDLYRAGKAESTLKHFLDRASARLRSL